MGHARTLLTGSAIAGFLTAAIVLVLVIAGPIVRFHGWPGAHSGHHDGNQRSLQVPHAAGTAPGALAAPRLNSPGGPFGGAISLPGLAAALPGAQSVTPTLALPVSIRPTRPAPVVRRPSQSGPGASASPAPAAPVAAAPAPSPAPASTGTTSTATTASAGSSAQTPATTQATPAPRHDNGQHLGQLKHGGSPGNGNGHGNGHAQAAAASGGAAPAPAPAPAQPGPGNGHGNGHANGGGNGNGHGNGHAYGHGK